MNLVTGATGLLGSHLLIELTRRGEKVRALYRSETKKSQTKQLFDITFGNESVQYWNQIEWFLGDVLDVVGLEDAMIGCSRVYHCAALVSFNRRDFSQMIKVNRRGTQHVVDLALHLNIEKLVHVSSTAVFTRNKELEEEMISEDSKWVSGQETSGYAISKYNAEREVWRGIEEGLNAVIINPSLMLGSGNWNDSSLKILRTVSEGFSYHTAGSNAFVDARDVAFCMVELMHGPYQRDRFLCTGTNITFKEALYTMAEVMGKPVPSKLATSWMSGLAWRLSWLKGLFTKNQTLTRESATSAQRKTSYDSTKIIKALDFEFRPFKETVEYAVSNRILDK